MKRVKAACICQTLHFTLKDGIHKAWFAFWVSEVIACTYSLWATKKELRNKVK